MNDILKITVLLMLATSLACGAGLTATWTETGRPYLGDTGE